MGWAGGSLSSGLPFLSANLSPVKQVAFRPHELMLGALVGFQLGEGTICSPPAEEGPPLPHHDSQPLGLGPSPVDCGIKGKGQRSTDTAALQEAPGPFANSGPPARLRRTKGAAGVILHGERGKEGSGKERWAGWLGSSLLTSS